MMFIIKACIEAVIAIILILALITTHAEGTKIVHRLMVVITGLVSIVCIIWWFI